MASSGVTTRRAPCSYARRAASTILFALPVVSPTSRLSWATQSLTAIARVRNDSNDYVTRVLAALDAVAPESWNALLAACCDASPFMRHEYLSALHGSGSAAPRTGWTPKFVTLWRGDELRAACPLYLKDHSYGEYV